MPLELPVPILEQVSDALLARYAALIYDRTGIRVSPQKKTLLSNRLRRRLRATAIDGFDDYYRHLKSLPAQHAEWDAFLQEITTHETFLFRDEGQWEWFRAACLPQIAAREKGSLTRPSLRIWSAACSTGDEAYTAACCIAATLPDLPRWSVQILGTDIGLGAVEAARAGLFDQRQMRLVPESYRGRFFTRSGESWQARPVLSQMVSFRQHNLLAPLGERPFDVVFLKNVLIYFDRASKERVMANVEPMLRPGGMLVAGAAEGVSDLVRGLRRCESWLFRRPE